MTNFYSKRETREILRKGWIFPLVACLCFLFAGSVSALTVSGVRAEPFQAKLAQAKPTQLEELTMINQYVGWALAKNRSAIFFTRQGPTHWTDVTPRGLKLPANDLANSITSSFFLDASHGYVGVLQNGETSLLSTHDSGKTWQTVHFDFSPLTFIGIYQITFIDSQHGWLAFDKDHGFGHYHIALESTSNGGKTWNELLDTTQSSASGLPVDWPKFFHFTGAKMGWATGNENYVPDVRLYFTKDGGKTWSKPNIPAVPGAAFTESSGPYFQDKKHGTLPVFFGDDTGTSRSLTVYSTHDGGKTWMMGPVLTSDNSLELRTLAFRNANDGWVLGLDSARHPVLRMTSNGGKSWKTIHPAGLHPFTEVIMDLDYFTQNRGWTINKDDNGIERLFQTLDGGRHWQVLHPLVG